MHATVRRYSMGAGSIDALMHRIDQEFAPAISQEPGFVCYFARDTGGGTVESTSVFADEASARRSDELAAAYVAENLSEFALTLTDVAGGEILVSRATPGALETARHWRRARSRPRRGDGAVLVIGATGRTGRQIVDRLVERDVPVTALVRDAARARRLLPRHVRLFVGDVRRPETLAAPMAGARAVIAANCGSAGADNSAVLVDYFGTDNLVKAAAAGGVGVFVFVSSIYASRPDHYQDVEPMSLGWKARGEELVRQSGIPYSIVRAGWLDDGPGGQPLVLTQGDTGEGRLSRADLAEVCAQVLFREDARGKTFEVVAAHAGKGASLEAAMPALQPDPVPL